MLRSQVSDAGGDTAKSYQQKAVACPLGIVRKKHLEDNQAKKKRERRSSLNVRWTFIGDNNGQNFFFVYLSVWGTVINARAKEQSKASLESKNLVEGGVLCYVEIGSSGWLGGSSCRNGLCSAVLPFHRCMRVSAVRPHSQKRQADTDAGDVYVGVGWEPKASSHTQVPEGP